MTDRLRDLAATAPVPVFIAVGHGADPVLADLRASDRVEVVVSPRQATVMVVAGHVPVAMTAALGRVHDQVQAPRGTVVVGDDPARLDLPWATRSSRRDLVEDLVAVHRAVVDGERSDPIVGLPENLVEWKGVGPHGQGGEGMMGGVPWGRPMAMPPTMGRDGLALDRLSLELGPFLAGLPPMVELEVGLQGDVLEAVTLRVIPPEPDAPGMHSTADPADVDPDLVALGELLAMAGLGAMATACARLARRSDRRVEDIAALRRRLDRSWGLRVATDGIGPIDLPAVDREATDRWRAWLSSASIAVTGDPRRVVQPLVLADVAEQMVGMEVGQAMLTLATLRPEVAASAFRPVVRP